ncbi:MAG TPA: hypothetical protein V6C81_23205 [Planktothrix sp.]|jgi:hypothetical protein
MAVAVFMHPEKVVVPPDAEPNFLIGFQLGEVCVNAVIWFFVLIVPTFIISKMRKSGKKKQNPRTAINRFAKKKETPQWIGKYQKALWVCFVVATLLCTFSPVIVEEKHWPACLGIYMVGYMLLFGAFAGIIFAIFYGIRRVRERQ